MRQSLAHARLNRIKRWILKRNPGLSDVPLGMDIIDQRLVDSLGFVSFLLFIEEVRGREIESRRINLDSFRTLRQIRDNFLRETGNGN